jgi:hypothetical protein
MTQATDYVNDGQVPEKRKVSVISNFLIGKAYTFYTREVSIRTRRWSLKQFFSELFNYCFPVNFRTIQQQKLEQIKQGDHSVKEYASKLNELFLTIGYTNRHEKANKLWYGLRPEIQSALWKDKLNP